MAAGIVILPASREQLPACLDILRRGYEDTAVRFGMTEQNCPYRGRTRLPLSELERAFDEGFLMRLCLRAGKAVGFLSMRPDSGALRIEDVAVLPEAQGQGCGTLLMRCAVETARALGCDRITLGMVHDNLRLRRWYESLGFRVVATRRFPQVTYTVATMELTL